MANPEVGVRCQSIRMLIFCNVNLAVNEMDLGEAILVWYCTEEIAQVDLYHLIARNLAGQTLGN